MVKFVSMRIVKGRLFHYLFHTQFITSFSAAALKGNHFAMKSSRVKLSTKKKSLSRSLQYLLVGLGVLALLVGVSVMLPPADTSLDAGGRSTITRHNQQQPASLVEEEESHSGDGAHACLPLIIDNVSLLSPHHIPDMAASPLV